MKDLPKQQSYISNECRTNYASVLNIQPNSAKENFELFKKWHETNDDSYREKIILGNLRLVLRVISNQYSQDYIVDSDDLFQIGIEGLIKAADTFDYQKGYSFITYATRVVENEICMVFRKMKYINSIMSLDTILETANTTELSLQEVIKDPNTDIEEDIMHVALISLLESAIDCLSEKEQDVLINVYGLYGHKVITQTEIAKKYNCSQPTISKIRIEAVNKIRRILLSKL